MNRPYTPGERAAAQRDWALRDEIDEANRPTVAILDHKDPARVACDSSEQKTFMARMHNASHPSQAQFAADYGNHFAHFLGKLNRPAQ